MSTSLGFVPRGALWSSSVRGHPQSTQQDSNELNVVITVELQALSDRISLRIHAKCFDRESLTFTPSAGRKPVPPLLTLQAAAKYVAGDLCFLLFISLCSLYFTLLLYDAFNGLHNDNNPETLNMCAVAFVTWLENYSPDKS